MKRRNNFVVWNTVKENFQNQFCSYLTKTYIFVFEYTIILSILHLLASKEFLYFFHITKWALIANININTAPAPDEFNQ